MISGRNALISVFTLDGIIRWYVSCQYFHVFSDSFWFMLPQIFWNWDIKVFADVPVDYIIEIVERDVCGGGGCCEAVVESDDGGGWRCGWWLVQNNDSKRKMANSKITAPVNTNNSL